MSLAWDWQLKKVKRRISEVEDSIAALDWELERVEIEKMKVKTKKVIKRISQIVEDDMENGDEVTTNIKRETVKVFMINKSMWNKYLLLIVASASADASADTSADYILNNCLFLFQIRLRTAQKEANR